MIRRVVDRDAEHVAQGGPYRVASAVTVLSAPAAIADKTTYNISFKFTDPGQLDSWAYSIAWAVVPNGCRQRLPCSSRALNQHS